jgi:hypothetical protein
MGIRGSCRHHEGLLLGLRDGQEPRELQRVRQPVGRQANLTGRLVRRQSVWPLRHGRQCVAMGAGLLSWQLRRSADRRHGVDQWGLQSPRRPRRFLGQQFTVPPHGQPLQEHHRRRGQHPWLPCREDDRYPLNLYFFTSWVQGEAMVGIFLRPRRR